MQANGGASEVSSAVGAIIENGNDSQQDLPNGSSGSQIISGNNVNQVQAQHHQVRNATSPINNHHHHHDQQLHHQPHLGSMASNHGGATTNHHQMHFTGHHHHHHHHVSQQQQQSSGYYQRHAQSYHNQPHLQHYPHHNHHHHHHQQQPQNKYNNSRGGDKESNINHVLLFTVINPHYTITCDLIHQICSTYGKVNRIVIFKKNGVQAMVEFDNIESAKRAKAMLHGCDIYSGCCTLRIEFAKPTRLNIHKNDHDSFDYTNPNLGNGQSETIGANLDEHVASSHGGSSIQGTQNISHNQQSPQSSHQVIGSRGSGTSLRGVSGGSNSGGNGNQNFHHHHSQSNPAQQSGNSQHGSSGYGIASSVDQSTNNSDAFHQEGGFNVSRGAQASGYVGIESSYIPSHGNLYSRQDSHHQHHHQPHHHHQRGANIGTGHNHSSFPNSNAAGPLMVGPSNLALPPQGTVMMVYGLHPERLNCDRLFNLFCLYGNVVRVKFLRTKEGCAMVQMGDVLAVDRCVSSLNKTTLFGGELQISYSKQAFLHDVIQPFILPDGSPSFKDFMGNKNNRFKNPEVASKNRILPPSQVLHFFNAPYGITEDELAHLFKQTAGHEPVSIKMFIPKTDSSKSFSGLVTFKDPADATETLVLCNHLNMPKPGAPHPYILRLCFSPPTYMRPPPPPSIEASAHR